MAAKIGNSWDTLLAEEFQKPYYLNLRAFLKNEYMAKRVFPDMHDIFTALKLTSYEDAKVVILGQDPYHGIGQAHGLAFSVKPGVAPPPSLLNMYKELKSDLGCYIPKSGNLVKWAKQGVLLLNAALTVLEGQANSHQNIGWSQFTDSIISLLNNREEPIIFLLWGNNARSKKELITNPNHFVLETVHPSPLSASRGFFGCKHFSRANEILKGLGVSPIDWQIED